MHDEDYLLVDPACEVNERGTRGKNVEKEVVDNCDLPLDREFTERVEVDDKLFHMPKKTVTVQNKLKLIKECSLTFPSPRKHARAKEEKTRRSTTRMAFVIDRIVLSDMMDSLVELEEVVMPQEIDLVNDTEQDWIEDCSEPEVEFEPETEQMHEQELTNLRVLEWLRDLPIDPKERILTIQGVDQNSIEYISYDNTESNWVAPDGPLRVPESNLDLLDFGRSTGTLMDILVRGVG